MRAGGGTTLRRRQPLLSVRRAEGQVCLRCGGPPHDEQHSSGGQASSVLRRDPGSRRRPPPRRHGQREHRSVPRDDHRSRGRAGEGARELHQGDLSRAGHGVRANGRHRDASDGLPGHPPPSPHTPGCLRLHLWPLRRIGRGRARHRCRRDAWHPEEPSRPQRQSRRVRGPGLVPRGLRLRGGCVRRSLPLRGSPRRVGDGMGLIANSSVQDLLWPMAACLCVCRSLCA
mmetsp:Transcript_10433/g.21568  ORF Transcript_10433/g.21568 Transcript_10433/m.21568 type:complete len:229 (-) Transcript_10433:68-754(-)